MPTTEGALAGMRSRIAMLVALVVLAMTAAPAGAYHVVFEHASLGPSGGNSMDRVENHAMSADGRHVVFETDEALTPDDTDAVSDVYRRTDGVLTRISTGPLGGNGPGSTWMRNISEDASVVVLESYENLVPEDVHGGLDVYKWSNGSVSLITEGPGWGIPTGMSRDGSHVFFESYGHFVDGDEETAVCSEGDPGEGTYSERPCWDVFEHFEGDISLVSTGPTDDRGPVDHELGDVSADGAAAVFESQTALLPEDTDNHPSRRVDIYKRKDGVLTLVTNNVRNEFEEFLFLSDDGGTVVFKHYPPGSHGNLWQNSGGVTQMRAVMGVWGTTGLYFGGASPDARHVFWSSQDALVPEDTDSCPLSDTGGCLDLYTHSPDTGVRLVSGGGPVVNEDFGYFYAVSRDGGKAYFGSRQQLDPADTDSSFDIYEFDVAGGTNRLISTGPTDTETKDALYVGVSHDGSRVFFYTAAKMVSHDPDVFGDIYERAGDTTRLVTETPGVNEAVFDSPGPTDIISPRTRVSADGSRLAILTGARLLPSDTLKFFDDVYTVKSPDPTPYPRPKAAFSMQVPLVQAAKQCTAPNRTHGPPLAFPSCAPPVPNSRYLTIGAGGSSPFYANSTGLVRVDVLAGAPGGPDDTDVALRVHLTNVWWQAGTRVDYDGDLRARIPLRNTDKADGVPATSQERTLEFVVPCTPTPDDAVGSTCSVVTTADAVLPGRAPERTRAVWELGPAEVYDGGDHGQATTVDKDRLFAVQGLFVP